MFKGKSENTLSRLTMWLSLLTGALLAALAAGIGASAAQAQSAYPQREISWIVGFPPGGYSDTVTRYLAENLSKKLGQPVNIENRPGAGGGVSAAAIANAKPDGYTLLNAGGTIWSTFPYLNKDLPYDPEKSFTLIHGINTAPLIMSVPANSPFKTLAELIAFAKANPGKLKYGTPGLGSTNHLTSERLAQVTGAEFVHVPYKGGAEVFADLLGGRLDFSFDLPVTFKPLIDEGRLRGLGQTSAERIAMLPDIPTMKELGYPDIDTGIWAILVGPAGMPQEAVDRLSRDFSAVLSDPAVVKFIGDRGLAPMQKGPGELKALIATEQAKMKALIDKLGIGAK